MGLGGCDVCRRNANCSASTQREPTPVMVPYIFLNMPARLHDPHVLASWENAKLAKKVLVHTGPRLRAATIVNTKLDSTPFIVERIYYVQPLQAGVSQEAGIPTNRGRCMLQRKPLLANCQVDLELRV